MPRSIRAQLHAIGIDDLPRNGAFILAGIDTTGGPRRDLPADLGVTKQAVSQLIDTLVNRGYLRRSPDPGDRRRIALELTDRGQQVVDAVSARRRGGRSPAAASGCRPEQIEAMRSVLLALAEIKSASLDHRNRAEAASTASSSQFSPIFPVRRPGRRPGPLLGAGLRHLRLRRRRASTASPTAKAPGCTWLLIPTPTRRTHASAYLYVRDADALYEEWSRPGIGGQTRPVGPTALQDARRLAHRPGREPDPLRLAHG